VGGAEAISFRVWGADMAVWQFALDPIPASKAGHIARDDDSSRELQLSSRERSAL